MNKTSFTPYLRFAGWALGMALLSIPSHSQEVPKLASGVTEVQVQEDAMTIRGVEPTAEPQRLKKGDWFAAPNNELALEVGDLVPILDASKQPTGAQIPIPPAVINQALAQKRGETDCKTLSVTDQPLPDSIIKTSPQNPSAPLPPPPPQPPPTEPKPSGEIPNIADQALRLDLIQTASEKMAAQQQAAKEDEFTLSAPYEKLTVDGLAEHLSRAKVQIDQTVRTLAKAPDATGSGDLTRFKNLYVNAKDKAEAGLAAIEEDRKSGATLPLTALPGLSGPGFPSALMKTPTLAEIFGSREPIKSATTPEALSNRILMFNGLPDKERKQIAKKLQLAEPMRIQLPGGKESAVTLLHNGYVFGGGKTAVDCSSFVTEALPESLQNARFSTMDFAGMWFYLRKGHLPKPPQWKNQRASILIRTAQSFSPINLYRNEALAVGDLLVYRLPSSPIGHVFIVRKFDVERKVASVVEAAQSAGTIREREFALSLDPESKSQRSIRPGLMGLRLRSTDNAGCKYGRQP